MASETNVKTETRELQLQAIADVVEHWLKWVGGERAAEGLETTSDTHVILRGVNRPPYWPSIGQLQRWLVVLRGDEMPDA